MPRRKYLPAGPAIRPIIAVIAGFAILASWLSQDPVMQVYCLVGFAFAGVIVISILAVSRERSQSLDNVNRLRSAQSPWTVQRLNTLDPYAFEHLITSLYKDLGYRAQHTGRAGDNGVDVVLHDRRGDKYVVQCKHKTVGNVGAGDIRDLIGTVAREKAINGVLCTNADFSQPARDTAKGHPIILYNGEDIARQLNKIAIKSRSE
jgi:restriction endonuclease Mrr